MFWSHAPLNAVSFGPEQNVPLQQVWAEAGNIEQRLRKRLDQCTCTISALRKTNDSEEEHVA